MDPLLIIVIIVVIAVVAYLLFRRRGASNVASSATNAVKDTASSAASMTKDAASGAASMTKDAASSAGSMASGAAASAGSMASGAASGASSAASGAASGESGAMAGAMGAVGATAGAMDLGQMTDMLGGIMNGNMQLDANSPLGKMVIPMADNLTTKLGLPKEVGAMVVTFALAKIAELMKAKSAGTGATPMAGGMNADQVLGKLNAGEGMDAGSLKSMGLTSELAKKTNLTEDQATQGLQMAMGELSAGLAGKTSYEGMELPDMSMLKSMMK